MKRITTGQFIKKARDVHKNKYDYSLSNYNHTHKKIKIICPDHGTFEQTPSSHLNGSGCPKCYGNKNLTTEEFINKSNLIHNNKYDYSLSKYN